MLRAPDFQKPFMLAFHACEKSQKESLMDWERGAPGKRESDSKTGRSNLNLQSELLFDLLSRLTNK